MSVNIQDIKPTTLKAPANNLKSDTIRSKLISKRTAKPIPIAINPFSNLFHTRVFNKSTSRITYNLKSKNSTTTSPHNNKTQMPNNTPPTLSTSILLLLNAITSKLVTITTFLTLIYFHNYFTLHFVVGSILNMLLGKAMKRILNIQRPTQSIKSDPGMPSSHATSLSYFATSFTLTASNPIFQYNSSFIILSSWLYVFTICYTRTAITNVHTLPQIAAGLMLGTTFASIWYYIVLKNSSVESVVFSDFYL